MTRTSAVTSARTPLRTSAVTSAKTPLKTSAVISAIASAITSAITQVYKQHLWLAVIDTQAIYKRKIARGSILQCIFSYA
jgi:hypothetical protein